MVIEKAVASVFVNSCFTGEPVKVDAHCVSSFILMAALRGVQPIATSGVAWSVYQSVCNDHGPCKIG